jgi:ribonuclease BN (tRNA processing enzyme)
MKLTILGSGSPIFNLKRYAPSFIVETKQKLLLFDCGWGCGINLLKAGYQISQLDHILISHPHADHMGNLMHITDIAIFESSISPYRYQHREKNAHVTHISPWEIGVITGQAQPKKIILMHLYDNATEQEIRAEIQKNYNGEVIISHDLEIIKIN